MEKISRRSLSQVPPWPEPLPFFDLRSPLTTKALASLPPERLTMR